MMCNLVLKLLMLAGFDGDANQLTQHCWSGAATQAGKYAVITVVILVGLLVRRWWKKLKGRRANVDPQDKPQCK